jgi:hypothetical protein
MTRLRRRAIFAAAVVAAALFLSPRLAAALEQKETPADREALGCLETTREVTLRGVTLVAGSRVRIVDVVRKDGMVTALDLELADGYVLRRVAKRAVASFRRCAD